MSRAKAFTSGQPVEVQREPGAKWEPAAYDKPQPTRPGYHLAILPEDAPARVITMPTSLRMADIEVRWLSVPARRIRASKAGVR